MIPLIGPGGAGKSTIGALVAERLGVPFVNLDRHFSGRAGDISEYIGRHGYCPLSTASCVRLKPSVGKLRVRSEDLRREKRP